MTSHLTALSGADHRPGTLADLFVPAFGSERTGTALRAVLLIIAGAAVTALAAQLRFTVPWTPVPYTGQTGAVLLVGVALGSRLGAASMTLYLLAGVAGLPIFTNGSSGVAHILGFTGGYLVAFVIAAALVGLLAERGWDRSWDRTALLMATGNLVIYLIGVPVLAVVAQIDPPTAITMGALVFIPWDGLKIAIAAGLLPFAWRLAGDRRGR